MNSKRNLVDVIRSDMKKPKIIDDDELPDAPIEDGPQRWKRPDLPANLQQEDLSIWFNGFI